MTGVSIAKNTIRTSVIFGLRLLLQAGTLVVLARLLGTAGFGSYVALGALAVILGAFASFGTHLVLFRNIARDPSSRDESLRMALGASFLCGSILLGLYVLLCVAWLRPMEGGLGVIVCLGVAELLFQPIFTIAVMERHGRGDIISSQLMLNLPLILRLIAALVVGFLASSELLFLFATGHLLAIFFSLVLAVAWAPASWPPPWRWRVPSTAEWRDASGYAFINAGASGVAEIDKMLAGKLLPIGVAGTYVAASRVIGALVLPVMAMVVSTLPRLFKQVDAKRKKLWGALFLCATGYGVVAGFAIGVLSTWLPVVFGSAYENMDESIRWLAWGVPAISLHGASFNILTTIDRPWIRVCLEVSGLGGIALMGYLLVPVLGAPGLAFSVVCIEWILAFVSWLIIWRLIARGKKVNEEIAK